MYDWLHSWFHIDAIGNPIFIGGLTERPLKLAGVRNYITLFYMDIVTYPHPYPDAGLFNMCY